MSVLVFLSLKYSPSQLRRVKPVKYLRSILERVSAFARRLVWIADLRSFKVLPSANVLLVCHDNDRGIRIGRLKYSPILDTLNERLIDEGMSTLTIALPFSRYYGKYSYGRTE